MDNKQEQDIDFDKLLGTEQEDTKIDFGDSKVSDLESFIKDEPVMEFSPLIDEKSADVDFVEEDNVEPVADFNDFKLEDLDSALKSFQEARRGKVSSFNKNVSQADEGKREDDVSEVADEDESINAVSVDVPQTENVSEQSAVEIGGEENADYYNDESFIDAEDDINAEADNISPKQHKVDINPMVLEDKDLRLQGISEKSEEILRWYSGKLDDKTYELSVDNMPEFLDTDKTIRVIHVNIASPYGWNVFFDNGIFMNLQDLQIYQTRHGKMPYNSGKIVYGSKTTQFENINRIVVYELPKYFSYKPE